LERVGALNQNIFSIRILMYIGLVRVRRRQFIPPPDAVLRQVTADLADAAFAEVLRQARGEDDTAPTVDRSSQFAPLATLLVDDRIPRAEARQAFRLYAAAYVRHLYQDLHAQGLEPMEWWKQLAGIGRTWIRLQFAALAHAAGAGVRIRTAQANSRTAQPSE
jgi:hypothetical protein